MSRAPTDGSGWQLFERLVSRVDRALEPAPPPARRRATPAELKQLALRQKLFDQIPEDALLLRRSPPTVKEIAAQRRWLRLKYGPWGISRVLGYVLPGAFAVTCVVGAVLRAQEMIVEGQILALSVVSFGLLILALFALVLVTALRRRTRRGMRRLREHLDAEAGLSGTAPVVVWLDRHWAWATPPGLLKHLDGHVRGFRRGRAFLVLSESEPDGDDSPPTPMSRTCVFIAAPGGVPRSLGPYILRDGMVVAQVLVTPAGLFGYWGSASTFWDDPPEEWSALLDGLLDLTDHEISDASHSQQAG